MTKPVNIYHCCIQKSASQWIKKILSDVDLNTIYEVVTPGKDYILTEKNKEELVKGFQENAIISPLYIDYAEFCTMKKPDNYKAFYVMRDPRDLIISRYFSMKESHVIMNKYQEKERKFLQESSIDDGLNYYINLAVKQHQSLYSSLLSWTKAKDNSNVMLCKYEDLISNNQFTEFKRLFVYCDLSITDENLERILDKNSFKKLSKGRISGKEDVKSHYRKGISGDWKNYFNEEHKAQFKLTFGGILISLGYESSNKW